MEAAHRLAIDEHHRDRERGLTALIWCVEVRSRARSEARECRSACDVIVNAAASACSQARHATIEGFRILLDQLPDQIQIADLHRREDVVPRAALDEECNQFAARCIPSSAVPSFA
jgi:hypothetical protein